MGFEPTTFCIRDFNVTTTPPDPNTKILNTKHNQTKQTSLSGKERDRERKTGGYNVLLSVAHSSLSPQFIHERVNYLYIYGIQDILWRGEE